MIIRVGDPDPEPVAEAQLPADPEPAEETQLPANPESASAARKKPRLTIEALRDELARRAITIRLNVISMDIDISGSDYPRAYLDKHTLVVRLDSDLSTEYTGCSYDRLSGFLDVIARDNAYNPVADYIGGLKWDKRSRFPDLVNLMGIEEDSLSQALLYKWLLQTVALVRNEDMDKPYGAEGVLVLKGAQGTGKTSLLRRLAMQSPWFGEGLSIRDYDKDTIRRVCTKFISELGEVETTLKSDIEALKNFITSSVDSYRLPYGKMDIVNLRHTSLAATCNSDRYLIDATGNRRWFTVPIDKRIAYADIQQFEAEQLWAEMWFILNECGDMANSFRLSDEEKRQLEIRNGDAEKYLKAEAEILDILAEAEEEPAKFEWREVTISDFKREYDVYLRQYSVEVIGKALGHHGYKTSSKRVDGKSGRYVRLPMKNFASSGAIPFSRGHTRSKTRTDNHQEQVSNLD